ncbi:MAG: 16S rRNA (adenine(1518)-N(6)/adenine(1519)-N(6))-dimethyltransferase RsmA [Agarilytica sp.]
MAIPRNTSNTPSGHRARKRFGQNFLVDQGIINHIVRSLGPKPEDHIVEIGPGQGAITGPLLEHNPSLQVIELDRDLIPVLLAQFAKYRDFKIHQHDALNFDFQSLLPSEGDKLRVVGNLPYNISTPLIFKLLENKGIIFDMHFMLQKEVVDRLAAKPGEKNYGRLSIMAQYHCEIESLFDVPPESFEPAPKVNSAIVRLSPYDTPPHIAKNTTNLEKFVKLAFQQRRKTLRNGLKGIVNDEQAAQVGLDLGLRAERLSVQNYVEMSNALWGEENMR